MRDQAGTTDLKGFKLQLAYTVQQTLTCAQDDRRDMEPQLVNEASGQELSGG